MIIVKPFIGPVKIPDENIYDIEWWTIADAYRSALNKKIDII